METRWMTYKNEDGIKEKFYPVTHTSAIITEDGNITLEQKINSINCESVGAIPEDQLNRKSFNNVDLLKTAFNLKRGIYYFRSSCTNLPVSDGSGFHVIVMRRENNETTPVIKLIAFDHNSDDIYYNIYDLDTKVWLGWTVPQFLPLIGGNLTGHLTTEKHIYPSVAKGNTNQLGITTNPWHYVMARNYSIRDANNAAIGSFVVNTTGTAETQGDVRLLVGNSAAAGTAGNARGRLFIYDTSKYYGQLLCNGDLTANRSFYFPNVSGTLLCANSGNLNMPITYTTANKDYSKYLLRGIAAGTSGSPTNNGNIFIKY